VTNTFAGFRSRWKMRERQRAAALDALLERLALEQLHHEVCEAVLLAVIADRDDVAGTARELRRDLRLELEAAGGVVVVHVVTGLDQLDRELAAQGVVRGEPDLAHRALADEANELVLPGDQLPDVDLHGDLSSAYPDLARGKLGSRSHTGPRRVGRTDPNNFGLAWNRA